MQIQLHPVQIGLQFLWMPCKLIYLLLLLFYLLLTLQKLLTQLSHSILQLYFIGLEYFDLKFTILIVDFSLVKFLGNVLVLFLDDSN